MSFSAFLLINCSLESLRIIDNKPTKDEITQIVEKTFSDLLNRKLTPKPSPRADPNIVPLLFRVF